MLRTSPAQVIFDHLFLIDGSLSTNNRAYPAVLYTQVSDITHSWIGYKLSAAEE